MKKKIGDKKKKFGEKKERSIGKYINREKRAIQEKKDSLG